MLKNFSKLPMSKKLAWIVTYGFIISYIFTYISYILWDKDTTFIFQYMFYAFSVVQTSYFVKSGVENISPNFKETFKDRQDKNEY